MKKLKQALSRKRGEGYIDAAVSMVVIMMLIVLALNVFSFLTIKQDMDYFAREMVEAAAVTGQTYADSTYARYNELADEVGFNPSYTWNANYHSGYRVQYGEPLKITLTHRTYVEGFGIFRIPVTLTATYSGLSQQYHK